MIVPERQAENYHALNVENTDQGQGHVEVLHFTDPAGRERVEVRVTRFTNTTARWSIETRDETP